MRNLFAMKDDMVKTGAAELEEIQQESKATHKWLDENKTISLGSLNIPHTKPGVTWPA